MLLKCTLKIVKFIKANAVRNLRLSSSMQSLHCCYKIYILYIWGETRLRGRSRPAATSKMECFVIIVNGWKPLTITTKRSILDVAACLDPHLLVLQCNAMQWLLSMTSYSNDVINTINTKKLCLSHKFINEKFHDMIYSDRRWKRPDQKKLSCLYKKTSIFGDF